MGTRGAYGFRIDGADKLSYNHFDSYPDALGDDVAAFIQNHTDDELRRFAKAIRLVPDSDKNYSRLRPYQGDLEALLRDGVFEMVDAREFPKDSLWCEWAYIINLDDGVLEVCKGFNKEKDAQHPRYAVDAPNEIFGDNYYGVRLLAAIPLSVIRATSSLVDLLQSLGVYSKL